MKSSELLLENTPRTLYHGTLRKFVPSIMAIGLMPSLGEFTKWAYQEYEEADIYLPELVFAADKEDLSHCVSAILGAMEQEKIEDTIENFFRYGAIVVLKHASEDFSHHDYDEEHPVTVEPGDYYREFGIKPDFAIMGNRLRNFLRRNGVIVDRHFFIDRISATTKIFQIASKQYPEKSKQEILNKIASLTDKQMRSIIRLQVKIG